MAHAGQAVAGTVLPPLAVADQNHRNEQEREGYAESKEKSHNEKNISTFMLSAKIIKMNIFLFHSEAVQHGKNGLVHHRWSTQVIVDIFRCRMIF